MSAMPTPSETTAPETADMPEQAERAQAVHCGDRRLALLHGWARATLDQFDLSAVPGAPPWLAGATNVEGQVVPVIDVLAWISPGQHQDATAKGARLLVGGSGQEMVALLFQGLPRIARVKRHASALGADKLAPFAIGSAEDDAATTALDAPALVNALVAELALV
jgi:chemotaxis signal transduction protein